MRGIYSITNTITGTIYYGQSKDIKRRLNAHLCFLNKNKADNPRLQNSWNKYGESAFVFASVELVEDAAIDLTPIEKKYCNSTENKFNLQDPERIFPASVETREKMSKSKQGKLRPEIKQKMSELKKGNKNWLGKTHSVAAKQKISLSLTGHKHSEETKQKLRLARLTYWKLKNG